MVDIQAGQELRVPVTVKNIGGSPGTFTLTGQIRYKNGQPAGTMFKQGTYSPHPSQIIPPSASLIFYMAKPNWGDGKVDAFMNLETLDILWEFTVSETGQKVAELDVDPVRHVWGPVGQFVQPRIYTVV